MVFLIQFAKLKLNNMFVGVMKVSSKMAKANLTRQRKKDLEKMYGGIFFQKEGKYYKTLRPRFLDLISCETFEECIEEVNYFLKSYDDGESFCLDKVKRDDFYLNKWGHYQCDLKKRKSNERGFTFVWDEDSEHFVQIDWNMIGFDSYEDYDNVDKYFPSNLKSYAFIYPYEIHDEVKENILHLDYLDLSFINDNGEWVSSIFSIGDENFVSSFKYIKGENPFKISSYDFRESKIRHVKTPENRNRTCNLCNEKIEEVSLCKYFHFGERKEFVFNNTLIDKEKSLMPFKYIHQFIEKHKIEDRWRKKVDLEDGKFDVQEIYFYKKEPVLSLRLNYKNVFFELDVKWKRKILPNFTTFFELENWEYENAKLVHLNSNESIKYSDKFILNETCPFCCKSLKMHEITNDEECEFFENETEQLKDFFQHYLNDRNDEHCYNAIQFWNEILKDEKTHIKVLTEKIEKKGASREKRNAKKKKNQTTAKSEGYIYFLKELEFGTVKVGLSKNYKRRMDEFGVLLPFTTELIHVIKVKEMRKTEKMIHEYFKGKRKYVEKDGQIKASEWFNLNENDIEKIKKNKYTNEICGYILETVSNS